MPAGGGENVGVVEGGTGGPRHQNPPRLGGVVAGAQRHLVRIDERQVRDGDVPPARVPLRIAERRQLHQAPLAPARQAHPRFLQQLAAGGVLHRFLELDESPRRRPQTLKWLVLSLHQQHARLFLPRQDDHVHGHRRPRIVVGVSAFRHGASDGAA